MGKVRGRLQHCRFDQAFRWPQYHAMATSTISPVGHPKSAFYSLSLSRNTAVVGKAIYMQFETVINLCQQMRMTDQTWIGILQRAREGDCSELDIKEIRKLILTNPNCNVPNFDKPPWNDAVLVTPRMCPGRMESSSVTQTLCQDR